MPNPLTIDTVEQRLRELQITLDGLTLDLHEAGVDAPGDQDPDDGSWDEATRHYLLAYNRHGQTMAELAKSGVAIDPDWTPPPLETRT